MIHSVRFKAILDTNIVYPVIIRDLLFWFAHYDLYTPKWSENIFDEWKSVMERKGVSESEAAKRVAQANSAFPDALVHNYQWIIATLNLPDPKDYLRSFGVKAITADEFLTDIIDLNQELAVSAFKEMVLHKRNPDLDEFEVLDLLRKSGLNDTANYLHAFL
jgi:hypothetical protein